ncbi:MAG: hypothetical protein U9R49_07440 [Bacteroidota bacterium]|nr:hypothetical protein [Bacteroidota bacterium]
MKKFIVTYNAPIDAAWKTAESTPEEMEEGMKAWMAWAQKCGDKLVDFGTPLGNGISLGPGGKSGASDSQIIGYSILQAANMKEAQDLLQDHPHLDWNAACEIEIHESLAVPQ